MIGCPARTGAPELRAAPSLATHSVRTALFHARKSIALHIQKLRNPNTRGCVRRQGVVCPRSVLLITLRPRRQPAPLTAPRPAPQQGFASSKVIIGSGKVSAAWGTSACDKCASGDGSSTPGLLALNVPRSLALQPARGEPAPDQRHACRYSYFQSDTAWACMVSANRSNAPGARSVHSRRGPTRPPSFRSNDSRVTAQRPGGKDPATEQHAAPENPACLIILFAFFVLQMTRMQGRLQR